MTRRPKPSRVRPDVSPFLTLLCAGTYITAHDTDSGEYRNPGTPTGWSHATFRQSGSRFYMLGQDGQADWAFARLTPSRRIVKLPMPGVKRHAQDARIWAAVATLRYAYGQNRTLPSTVEVKAPTDCQRPDCNRTLTAGRSLTLRCHPAYGLGFFGPDCFKRDNPEANKRAAGLRAMSELLANTPPQPHVTNCPCPKCGK